MRYFTALVVAGLFATACGSSSSVNSNPVSSSAPAVPAIAGSWSGNAVDSGGQAQMSWVLTQNGSAVTGQISLVGTDRPMVGNGTINGTENGQTLTFHIDVPAGGFLGAMSSCALAADGQAMLSADGRTLTGTYSGNLSGTMAVGGVDRSCGGAVSNGQFTLSR